MALHFVQTDVSFVNVTSTETLLGNFLRRLKRTSVGVTQSLFGNSIEVAVKCIIIIEFLVDFFKEINDIDVRRYGNQYNCIVQVVDFIVVLVE